MYESILLGSDGFPEDIKEVIVIKPNERVNGFHAVLAFVFGHPLFLKNYLTKNLLSSRINDLVKTFSELSETWCNELKEVWIGFKDRIIDVVMSEIPKGVSSQAIASFSTFRTFMSASELDDIFTACLSSINDKTNSKNSQILSILLLYNSDQIVSTRTITSEALSKLLRIVQSNNLNEETKTKLEQVLLFAVRSSIQPSASLEPSETINIILESESQDVSLFAELTTLIDDKILDFWMTNLTPLRSEIVSILVSVSPFHGNWVFQWILKKKSMLTVSWCWQNSPIILGLIECQKLQGKAESAEYVSFLQDLCAKMMESGVTKAAKRISGLISFSEASESLTDKLIWKSTLKEPKVLKFFFASQSPEYCKSFIKNLVMSVVLELTAEKSVNSCRWINLYSEFFDFTFSVGEDLALWVTFLRLCVLRAYFVYSGRRKQVEEEKDDMEQEILDLEANEIMSTLKVLTGDLKKLMGKEEAIRSLLKLGTNPDDSEFLKKFTVKSFIITTMRYRLDDCNVLRLLEILFETFLKHQNFELNELLPYSAEAIIDMIFSHSKFESIVHLPKRNEKVILEPETENSKETKYNIAHQAKDPLLHLIFVLIQTDPIHCCKPEHLRPLTTAYSGTLSRYDVTILEILSIYEVQASISVSSQLVDMWGTFGKRKKESKGAMHSIDKIEPSMMFGAIQNFCIGINGKEKNGKIWSSSCQSTYDPNFFIPLAAAAVEEII
ncbi:nucleolar pre-ribosomal-associated protein 1, partial [Nowakowskiella sp. JEL0078]